MAVVVEHDEAIVELALGPLSQRLIQKRAQRRMHAVKPRSLYFSFRRQRASIAKWGESDPTRHLPHTNPTSNKSVRGGQGVARASR